MAIAAWRLRIEGVRRRADGAVRLSARAGERRGAGGARRACDPRRPRDAQCEERRPRPDRALELAQASPTGPVYLALPREVLGEELEARADAPRKPRARPEPPRAATGDIERAAEWIAAATHPLIITGQLGRNPSEAVLLTRLAERFALPVVPGS